MLLLHNRTPFRAEAFVLPDAGGREVDLIVAVALFEGERGEVLRPCAAQRPVRAADEHHGEAGLSSLRYESDLALEKPRVDVIVNACAHAPGGAPVRELRVELCVGERRKPLLVRGDRRRLGRWFRTRPRRFARMPIVYERAFGGSADAADPRNPLGIGHRGARSADPAVQSEFPNVERAGEGGGAPAGFGAVARGWLPRIALAGSFDANWQRERWPFLPQDFDPRHYQCAPEDQQFERVDPGERIRLVNLTADGEWAFRVPDCRIPATLVRAAGLESRELAPDTICIDAEERRVAFVSRLALPVQRGGDRLREVMLGAPTRGWLRAKSARKPYIAPGALGRSADG